jgi:hypothetical protein
MKEDDMGARKRVVGAAAMLLLAAAACNLDADENEPGTDMGDFYGLGDDHRLYRWDGEATAPVLDLSGIWDRRGDVGTVLRSSLSIDPRQRHAAWVAGGGPDAALMFGDLETGEITTAVEYPVDHACIDPTWLADGSAVLAHRAPVWGHGTDGSTDATPLPVETWGPTEWHAPDSGALPTTVDLDTPGCRLRWYTTEDGAAQAVYHDLDVTEFYRVDTTGRILETILVQSLEGAEQAMIGLVDIDPTGRYACTVDDYGPHGAEKGGFTIRAEEGTSVIDLHTGEAIDGDNGCTSVHADGYVSRDDTTVAYIDYQGGTRWATELPAAIAESPVLFYFPEED